MKHLPEQEIAMAVDLPLVHRACAVANAVDSGDLAGQIEQLEQMAMANPRRAAELVLMLAAAAGERAQTPEGVLEGLDGVRAVDLMDVAREAHRMYEDFRRRGDLVALPRWAIVGYKVYTRNYYRRRTRRMRSEEPSSGAG